MSDPFEQLTRSHRRLEERLRDLVAAARDDGVDTIGARDVVDFLSRQVRRHEADEEESLFPRLAREGEVAPIVAQLQGEHAAHVALHRELERLLGDEPVNTAEVRRAALALEDAYRTHIDVEEAVLFPAARRILSSQDLSQIFDEMQARRDRGPAGGGRRGDRR